MNAYFRHKTKAYMDVFFREHFGAAHYFICYEFQGRGMPHTHGIVWIDGWPDLPKLLAGQRESVRKKIETLCGYITQAQNDSEIMRPHFEKPSSAMHEALKKHGGVGGSGQDFGLDPLQFRWSELCETAEKMGVGLSWTKGDKALLATRVQVHVHRGQAYDSTSQTQQAGKTCLDKHGRCKYSYPRKLRGRGEVCFAEHAIKKKTREKIAAGEPLGEGDVTESGYCPSLRFLPATNYGYTVETNHNMLAASRNNGHCQAILDIEAVGVYISGYLAKGEKRTRLGAEMKAQFDKNKLSRYP